MIGCELYMQHTDHVTNLLTGNMSDSTSSYDSALELMNASVPHKIYYHYVSDMDWRRIATSIMNRMGIDSLLLPEHRNYRARHDFFLADEDNGFLSHYENCNRSIFYKHTCHTGRIGFHNVKSLVDEINARSCRSLRHVVTMYAFRCAHDPLLHRFIQVTRDRLGATV